MPPPLPPKPTFSRFDFFTKFLNIFGNEDVECLIFDLQFELELSSPLHSTGFCGILFSWSSECSVFDEGAYFCDRPPGRCLGESELNCENHESEVSTKVQVET